MLMPADSVAADSATRQCSNKQLHDLGSSWLMTGDCVTLCAPPSTINTVQYPLP